jgi:hypothetical protein
MRHLSNGSNIGLRVTTDADSWGLKVPDFDLAMLPTIAFHRPIGRDLSGVARSVT